MGRIFINYRRQDSEGYVGRLYDHLVQQFGVDDIFMDVDSIAPGADFVQVLEDAVASCDVFLAMIGPQWATIEDGNGERRLHQWNDFVRLEIASALKQQKWVIPVLVGQAQMPSPDMLPDDLQAFVRRNAIELSHQRFGHDVEKLIRAIKEAMPANSSIKTRMDTETQRLKADQLKAVRDDLVRATDSPLYAYRTENRYFPVLGEGNPDANILFIGEAPGSREVEQGRPFIGPSGDVLDEMMQSIGLDRDDVYLTNIVLDRTPDNRSPNREELAFYAPFQDRIVDIIRPAVIATLGRFAMEYLLKKLDLPEKRGKISQLHGKLIQATMPYGPIHVLPLYHPAVVLYSASQKDTLRRDFEKLKLFI
ncbi:TIR domain-containing protein [Phototrophicus methaneseepsis]|uniref:Type-4 uracil-DNA glycosylase n=1 Tax=Phototrophicus methaneseepsis TaxID=2710758 RepID=A0A7S8E868_9CHLR|nr:uracil-DNA glycosylase family protein [Phototrophicus methaneseepsis]QPC82188.1 TIR domain-containing protein [Phototrophicus methaneseepsis]